MSSWSSWNRAEGAVFKGECQNLGQPTCLPRADQPGLWLTTRTAGVMQWTVRLKATTSAGEVKTTELVTFNQPAVVSTAWFKSG